jgi:prepilin-type N-terminal cleavage/methylation domain-containing protein
MSRKFRSLSRRGFTLAEILVVIVLGSVIAAALYQVLVYQQRFYRSQRAAIAQHDALRLAAAVLTADLMEASGTGGDFVTIEPDELSLRSPTGFAIVCDVDTASGRLGVFDVEGRVNASAGDSLLVYHPAGWQVHAVQALEAADVGSLSCPYTSGPSLERVVQVSGSITGVLTGAPVRAFHRYTYRLEEDGGSWWMAREDASDTEILAGPFSGGGSGLTFSYLDEAGDPTTDPTRIARLDLTLVAEDPGAMRNDTLRASVRPRNQ